MVTDPEGIWNAVGWSGADPDDCMDGALDGLSEPERGFGLIDLDSAVPLFRRIWVTVEVPLPEEPSEVVGTISHDTDEMDVSAEILNEAGIRNV